jgi:hypothetical protein
MEQNGRAVVVAGCSTMIWRKCHHMWIGVILVFLGKFLFYFFVCLGFLLRTRTITDRYNITTEWHTQRDLLANTDNTAEENSLIFFLNYFSFFWDWFGESLKDFKAWFLRTRRVWDSQFRVKWEWAEQMLSLR